MDCAVLDEELPEDPPSMCSTLASADIGEGLPPIPSLHDHTSIEASGLVYEGGRCQQTRRVVVPAIVHSDPHFGRAINAALDSLQHTTKRLVEDDDMAGGVVFAGCLLLRQKGPPAVLRHVAFSEPPRPGLLLRSGWDVFSLPDVDTALQPDVAALGLSEAVLVVSKQYNSLLDQLSTPETPCTALRLPNSLEDLDDWVRGYALLRCFAFGPHIVNRWLGISWLDKFVQGSPKFFKIPFTRVPELRLAIDAEIATWSPAVRAEFDEILAQFDRVDSPLKDSPIAKLYSTLLEGHPTQSFLQRAFDANPVIRETASSHAVAVGYRSMLTRIRYRVRVPTSERPGTFEPVLYLSRVLRCKENSIWYLASRKKAVHCLLQYTLHADVAFVADALKELPNLEPAVWDEAALLVYDTKDPCRNCEKLLYALRDAVRRQLSCPVVHLIVKSSKENAAADADCTGKHNRLAYVHITPDQGTLFALQRPGTRLNALFSNTDSGLAPPVDVTATELEKLLECISSLDADVAPSFQTAMLVTFGWCMQLDDTGVPNWNPEPEPREWNKVSSRNLRRLVDELRPRLSHPPNQRAVLEELRSCHRSLCDVAIKGVLARSVTALLQRQSGGAEAPRDVLWQLLEFILEVKHSPAECGPFLEAVRAQCAAEPYDVPCESESTVYQCTGWENPRLISREEEDKLLGYL